MKLKVACLAVLSISVFSFLPATQSFAQNLNSNDALSTNSKKVEDGLSFATAIIITETTELKGLNAENKWIKEHYSNYKLKTQTLSLNNNIPYDVITILLSDGKEVKLYFNIASFYDKL